MRDKFIFEAASAPSSDRARDRQESLLELFDAHKGSRRTLERVAYDRLGVELKLSDGVAATHEALHQYEQTHLSIGSWPRLRASLKLRWRRMRIAENGGRVQLWENFGSGEERIGTIFLAHLRFERLAPQPTGLLNEVYVRRNDQGGRHYIGLPGNGEGAPPIFVRRFVIRGLNGHNTVDLEEGRAMRAAHYTRQPARMANWQPQERTQGNTLRHPLPQPPTASEAQQLLSHARGWKKRYISTGVGNRLPLSTRGTVFLSLFGNVVIDLARVPADAIFDLHGPTGAARHLGLDAELVMTQGSGYPASDYEGEWYLALRDVLRTRELVIKREVPTAAIIGQRAERRILAISLGRGDPAPELIEATLSGSESWQFPTPEQMEPERFVWSDGRRWTFVRYHTTVHCTLVANGLRRRWPALAPHVRQLHVWRFTAPDGMVLN